MLGSAPLCVYWLSKAANVGQCENTLYVSPLLKEVMIGLLKELLAIYVCTGHLSIAMINLPPVLRLLRTMAAQASR
jgi:hypothetical protein